METTPIITAVVIVLAVAAIGVVIAWWRSRSTFSGFEDLAEDTRRIAASLKAEIFRDGHDLLISGNHQKLPTVVRFSHDEHAPGLNVRMQVPATFGFSLVPKGAEGGEGGAPLRTGDDVLDAKFQGRRDARQLSERESTLVASTK